MDISISETPSPLFAPQRTYLRHQLTSVKCHLLTRTKGAVNRPGGGPVASSLIPQHQTSLVAGIDGNATIMLNSTD
jgi:hypothetical protein